MIIEILILNIFTFSKEKFWCRFPDQFITCWYYALIEHYLGLTYGLNGVGTAAPAHDWHTGVLLIRVHFKTHFICGCSKRGQHLLYGA